MQPVPYTWNTHDLTTYNCQIAEGSPLFGNAQFGEIQRSGTWPVRGGKTFSGNVLILVLTPTAGQHVGAFRDLMGLWFNEETDEEPILIIKDQTTGTSNKQWYVNGEFIGFIEPTSGSIKVMIHVSDPIWKSVTVDTNSLALTASGQSKSITVGGNRIARPQYSLKPTSARTGGYGYKRYIAIANQTDSLYADAINVTNGNLSTSALVGAGKMLASGYDLRITKNGAEIYTWLGGGGANSATTRPICNLVLPPQIKLTLSGTISAVGAVSSITVKPTAENKAALTKLGKQKNKVIAINLGGGSQEIYTFTSTTPSAYTINGTTRAARLSTNQAQVDGAIIRHIPFDIYMLYGNSAATDPAPPDSFKPMYDIVNSTNTSRVYTDYSDPANPNRLGQWVSAILKNTGGLCQIYTANHFTQAVPASEMGMYIAAYKVGSTPKSGTGTLQWTLTHPAGITSITPSGEKFRRNTGTGWPVATLKRFDGISWATVATEATPSAANTWEATTTLTGAQALGAIYKSVGFFFDGPVAAIADTYAAIEFDSITVAIDSSTIPLIWFGSETVNEWQDFKVTNSTTGQYMTFSVPGDVNNTVYVDTKALDAYVVETGERFPVFLDDESRADWLPLDPAQGSGINSITVTQNGLNNCTLTVTHEERNV